jgi:2,5-diketo-D-gluconate reductase A
VPDGEVGAAVKQAIRLGYRAIDTAQGYDNEKGVGAAIKAVPVRRDELFITSKLRTKSMGYDATLKGVQESLDNLGLDYLDMFLIHWPTPARDIYVETWKALIRAQRDGLVRSIGVSNFLEEHLERIIGETGIVPVVNQIETHPRYQQRAIRKYLREHDIRHESYSPLGSGAVLDEPVLADIAKKHGKSPAQAILRWHIQQDLIVIPKSVTPERIAENLAIFDFELDDDDLNRVEQLDDPVNGKTGSHPEEFNDLY